MNQVYLVRIFDPVDAAIRVRRMEATNVQGIHDAAEIEGRTVLSISPIRSSSRSRAAFNILLFCQELRTLLFSGMSLVEAIDTLASRGSDSRTLEVVAGLQSQLNEGKPFSTAMTLSSFPFPILLIAAIRASERTSRIDEALEEFVEYETIGIDMRKRLVSAAIYPSMVVTFGGAVVIFMMTYVVPRFARVYEDFAHGVSGSTIILMTVGKFFSDNVGIIFFTIASAFFILVRLWKNKQLERITFDILNRVPMIRYHIRLYQLSRFYQTVAMLLKGGYAFTDAVPLASDLATNPQLRGCIDDSLKMIVQGKSVSSAFSACGLTETVSTRLIQVGERSGDLTKIMEIIGAQYRDELILFVERTTRIAEPVLLMVVATMVGLIIILMYMPIFDLAAGI